MARAVGAFGPVRFPVYPPTDRDRDVFGLSQAEGVLQTPAIEHVHGFHAAALPPVLFLEERWAAVASGKLVVTIDLDDGVQDFFRGHSDAVTCLASTSEQGFAASGQVRRPGSRCAEVLLWSPETLQLCTTFSYHQADIEAIGFVQGGEVLITIGTDRDHTLAFWGVAKDRALRARKLEKVPLAVASAYKSGSVHGLRAAPDREGQASQFVTFGTAHVKFWRSDRLCPALESRRGAFGPEGAPRAVVQVAWTGKDRLVAGGTDGEIFFFEASREGIRAVRRLQLQQYSVALMVPLREALLVVYAHGLCSLLRGDGGGTAVDVDLASLPGAPDARMQSPLVGGKAWRQSSLLLASRTHLLHVDLAGGLQQPQSVKTLLVQPSRALTAVCVHPAEPRLLTGALDGGVRCYRSDTHQPIPEKSFKAAGPVTCLAISSCSPGSSAWLAVGCEDSTLAVLGEASLNYAFRRSLAGRGDKRARLTCARFSMCDCSGSHPLWLAVGDDNGCIHTFRFKDSVCRFAAHTGPETVTKVATLRGHAAPIFELSFASTLPCNFLLSTDTSGQVLAFDVPMGRRLPSVSLVRDVPFSPWTCPIGWQVQGCWETERAVDPKPALLPSRRFCEIVGRSLVAASDMATPAVELFPFPCPSAPSGRTVRLDGPASPISALIHSSYSDRLFAASDTVVFVWGWSQTRLTNPMGDSPMLDTPSPLRPVQGGVFFETPEGRKKHALAADDMALLTPQRQSPARAKSAASRRRAASKENLGLASVAWGEQYSNTPPTSKRTFRPPQRGKAVKLTTPAANIKPSVMTSLENAFHAAQEDPEWGDAALVNEEQTPLPDVGPLPGEDDRGYDPGPLSAQASPAESSPSGALAPGGVVAPGRWDDLARDLRFEHRGAGLHGHAGPKPVFFLGGGPAEGSQPEALGFRSRAHDGVSPKIGACDYSQVASTTLHVRDDTEARARSVYERQQCDSVGFLLGGSNEQNDHRRNTTGAVALAGRSSECSSGPFLYRTREVGSYFEIDVLLRRGRLLRVLRNPARRTLTFEGESMQGAEERLVVRVPPGFDLVGPPAHVERNFAEGRCGVAVQRRGAGRERAASWDGTEL